MNRLIILFCLFSSLGFHNCTDLAIIGCTDPSALNYNEEANIPSGACLYGGCIDTLAFNFSEMATDNDTSCLYIYLEDYWLQSGCNGANYLSQFQGDSLSLNLLSANAKISSIQLTLSSKTDTTYNLSGSIDSLNLVLSDTIEELRFYNPLDSMDNQLGHLIFNGTMLFEKLDSSLSGSTQIQLMDTSNNIIIEEIDCTFIALKKGE